MTVAPEETHLLQTSHLKTAAGETLLLLCLHEMAFACNHMCSITGAACSFAAKCGRNAVALCVVEM